MAIEITIDGTTWTVTKQELLDLAAKGIIGPETTIQVNGKFWKAGQIKDIVFGGAANETIEIPDEINSSPVRSNTTVTGATGNSPFSSELKNNCGRIGGILMGLGCLGWFFIGGTPLLFFGGIFLNLLGLILLIVSWVIPEDPAVLQKQTKELTAEELEGWENLIPTWSRVCTIFGILVVIILCAVLGVAILNAIF